MELLQVLLAGVLALGLIWFFRPGIRASMERSKNAPKDWPGVIIPIVLVVLFVMLLGSLL